MTGARHQEEGIALVEVLVAFLLVALALTTLSEAVTSSSLRTQHLESLRAAELVARSELAAAGIAYPLTGRPVAGTEGPFQWVLESQAVGAAGESQAGMLWRVRVTVRLRSGGDPLVQLRSMRLVRV